MGSECFNNFCQEHTEFVKTIGQFDAKIENLTRSADILFKRIGDHIVEGERPGGHRDRLSKLEVTVANLEKNVLLLCFLGGIIGGLLGKLTPTFLDFMVKKVFAMGGW